MPKRHTAIHVASIEADPQSVSGPSHYIGSGGMEAIDVIESFKLRFHRGNAVKYILRSANKDAAIDDLKKARWYLNRAINLMVNGESIDNL